jgi:serine/threonine protein kinase
MNPARRLGADRDLKPENILLHDSGHIMLTDFDLSKQASVTAPQVKQSMFGRWALGLGGASGLVVEDWIFRGHRVQQLRKCGLRLRWALGQGERQVWWFAVEGIVTAP